MGQIKVVVQHDDRALPHGEVANASLELVAVGDGGYRCRPPEPSPSRGMAGIQCFDRLASAASPERCIFGLRDLSHGAVRL